MLIFSPFTPPRHCINLHTLVLTFARERYKDNIISASYAYDLSLVKIKIFSKINNRQTFVAQKPTNIENVSALIICHRIHQRNKMTFERNLVSKVQLRSWRWYLDTRDKFAISPNIFRVILSPKITQKSLSQSFAKFPSNCGDIMFQYSREISGSCRRFFLRKRR